MMGIRFTSASSVAAEVSSRMSAISKANGAATDIGLRVFRGRHQINDDVVPCVSIFEADDDVQDEQGKHSAGVKLAQRYVLVAYDHCDADAPNDQAHLILADLKRAIFKGDRTFGGKVLEVSYRGRAIGPRSDGVAVVSARIDIDVTYYEDLSNP